MKTAGITALAIVFLLTVMTALGVALKNERQLSPWGTGFFFIASGSMEPNLPVGSLIFVSAVSAESIKNGDIITFFAANERDIVTHRVTAMQEENGAYVYTTKGDANNTDDQPLSYERVIGRVMLSIPGMSSFVNFFHDAKYLGIAVIGAGAILCVFGLIGANRRKDDQIYEEE